MQTHTHGGHHVNTEAEIGCCDHKPGTTRDCQPPAAMGRGWGTCALSLRRNRDQPCSHLDLGRLESGRGGNRFLSSRNLSEVPCAGSTKKRMDAVPLLCPFAHGGTGPRLPRSGAASETPSLPGRCDLGQVPLVSLQSGL